MVVFNWQYHMVVNFNIQSIYRLLINIFFKSFCLEYTMPKMNGIKQIIPFYASTQLLSFVKAMVDMFFTICPLHLHCCENCHCLGRKRGTTNHNAWKRHMLIRLEFFHFKFSIHVQKTSNGLCTYVNDWVLNIKKYSSLRLQCTYWI